MKYSIITIILIGILVIITGHSGCSTSSSADTENPNGFDFTLGSTENSGLLPNVQTGTTKNIIIFIGDGMQLENEIALSRYLYGADSGLAWHDFEYQGCATTWDIDTYNRFARNLGKPAYTEGSFDPIVGFDPFRGGEAPWPIGNPPDPDYLFTALPTWDGGAGSYAIPATDSASAATALATGHKTDQGNISWESGDPPDGKLATICDRLSEAGVSTGVVTSVEFSHATPSAFVGHNVNRGNPGQIAHEIITETKPDVVIGGGHPDWISGYISNSDYTTIKNSTEYIFVERMAGVNGGDALLNAADSAVSEGKKLFGLFGGSNGCFEPAVPHDTPGSPGFDVNEENPSLAEATDAALNVLGSRGDGFFLMVEQGDIDWANHYNDYRWMIGAMWDLDEAVKAAVEFVNRPDDNINWNNTLIIVTSDHATGGLRLSDSHRLGSGDMPEMTGTKYHYNFPGGEVDYRTTVHINEPVMVYATGAGTELFGQYEGMWYPGTRLIDDTEIYEVMMEFAGSS
ncbi:MAG: alkaline phosphatase [bacterium]|nr:alkaline phosphatase [bacterium]